jgi:hypothetical protein
MYPYARRLRANRVPYALGIKPGMRFLIEDGGRKKVVYAAAAPVVVMPRSWSRVCMSMRIFS